jgi:hypothetical protein
MTHLTAMSENLEARLDSLVSRMDAHQAKTQVNHDELMAVAKYNPARKKTNGTNEELHNLYFSPYRMIKSRRMRWAQHVARMGRRGMYV